MNKKKNEIGLQFGKTFSSTSIDFILNHKEGKFLQGKQSRDFVFIGESWSEIIIFLSRQLRNNLI